MAPDSVTETFLALKLSIDNFRWAGVPIYLPLVLGDRLPLYLRLRARALVELRPRQDTFEPHGVALVLRAIGRRLGPH